MGAIRQMRRRITATGRKTYRYLFLRNRARTAALSDQQNTGGKNFRQILPPAPRPPGFRLGSDVRRDGAVAGMGTLRNEVKIESADLADRWNVLKRKSAEDPKSRRRLRERAAAGGAGASGATKAMAPGEDFAILHHRGIDVPEMKHAGSIVPVHVEHLIEIAVADF